MSYCSITLKLYKPSREKMRLIEEAMANYTRAFDFLLTEAGKSISDLEKNYSGSTYRVSKWIDKDISKKLNQFHVEPFKDSIRQDFAMTMDSYFKLKSSEKKIGFPFGYVDSAGELLRVRPIFFCRYDIKRDYCLLYNPDKNRYYLKFYLLNSKAARIRQNEITEESNLQYIHESALKHENRKQKERYIIVPLAFGTWQEHLLKKCLDHPHMLKTARLIRRNDDYYITLNLECTQEEKIKAQTYMGISRGIKGPLCYTVTDHMGLVLKSGIINLKPSVPINKLNMAPEIYQAANEIIEKALAFRSQVILENTKVSKALRMDGDDKPILSKSVYHALDRVLSYKLDYKGLPHPVRVSPSGIFFTCPKCGKNTKKNKAAKDMFLCVSCGAVYELDSLGSLNLANKLIKYSSDSIKIKVSKEADGIYFSNHLLGLSIKIPGSNLELEGCMENLSDEIIKKVKEIKESNYKKSDPVHSQKWSMVYKIEGYNNIMEHIKLV